MKPHEFTRRVHFVPAYKQRRIGAAALNRRLRVAWDAAQAASGCLPAADGLLRSAGFVDGPRARVPLLRRLLSMLLRAATALSRSLPAWRSSGCAR